ncbi:MAG TPA: beta-L-arabinofuranosidase domain-containing protein [Terriglobia bacterium]|nr:beta-L-arabinofuranosidase domain-containing protein [Terriglobia bacterium]
MGAPSLSRRQWLQNLAGATALASTRKLFGSPAPQAVSREKVQLFRYRDVKLTGGPLKAQFDRIHAYYLGVNEDGLLKEFRVRAGLPAPGEYAGGWYDRDGFAPGHCFGQLISALARFSEATGDEATRAKAQRLVDGFAATIAPDGYCYPSQKASTNFPAYTYDKFVIGLLDAHQFAGVSSALQVLDRATRGAVRYMPPRALDRQFEASPTAPDDESYTLGENCFYAYEVTGEAQYLDMAKRYLLDKTYFDPLSRGQNVLPGRHAYSHCNALSSAARAYLDLGDVKYLQAIQNAWDMIVTSQQFASGGWGPNEAFVEPGKGKLGESLASTHAHFETPCGSYAHLKLARYLLRFTGQARYGDGLERVLYNTVLGAKDPSDDGHFFYYSDYHPSTRKTYFLDRWPCCAGTLPQVVADYVISAYFHGPDGIYVNLYTPSEANWSAGNQPVKLTQTTNYPESESSELTIEVPAPTEFTLYLRIPGWTKSSPQLSVNEKSVSVPAEAGTFAAIRRVWRNHDTVQITLPFSFRTEAIDDHHPNTVAVMRGPLMMVALDPQLTLRAGASEPAPALKPVPSASQTFEVPGSTQSIRFAPFYTVGDQSYTTYLDKA